VYFCPCDFLQNAAFGKSLSKPFASPADLRLALALANVLEIRARECTGKKTSVTGRGRLYVFRGARRSQRSRRFNMESSNALEQSLAGWQSCVEAA